MKRFVIVTPRDGNAQVTDYKHVALFAAKKAGYFVFDTQNGMRLCSDGHYYPSRDLDEPDDVDQE